MAAPFVNCIAKPRTFAVRAVKHKKMEEKMMVKAIMHGCNGKMGQVISNLVKEDDGIEIVAGIDKYTGVKMNIRFLRILRTVMWRQMS